MDIAKENMQQRFLEGRTLTLVCVHTGVKQLFCMKGDVTSLGHITRWRMRAECTLGRSASRSKRSSCLVTVLCSGEFFFQASWKHISLYTVTSFVNLWRGQSRRKGACGVDPDRPDWTTFTFLIMGKVQSSCTKLTEDSWHTRNFF